jgi:hypothetical protein
VFVKAPSCFKKKKDEKERLQARVAGMINGLEGMTYCMKRD